MSHHVTTPAQIRRHRVLNHPVTWAVQSCIGILLLLALTAATVFAIISARHHTESHGCIVTAKSSSVISTTCGPFNGQGHVDQFTAGLKYDIASEGYRVPALSIRPRITSATQR